MQLRLHVVRKHIRFVNFQIIDMLTGLVRLHPFIDRSFQRERRIALSAHISAVAFARSAQLKTGDDTSVIANHKTGAARTAARAWIPIEIAILKCKAPS